ncbi:MAG: HAD-IA family hydrolase [Candidatus Omnitrophica bacterium]|jgi:HAD superfamily hydrolase (TIGR01549 family)|nr:HAD-IA family hydrolase [Candidatus Omnitrophota bacterium]
MANIKMIIFDLDGTLVDSRQDIVEAVNHMLVRLGLKEKSFDEVISCVGNGINELIRACLGKDFASLKDRAFEIYRQYYQKHPADNAYLYPGVLEMLDFFCNKEKAVVTNRNHNSSLLILRKLGIERYFNNIIGDDNTSCLKPSRCQFDRLFKKTSVNDKRRVLMVGDMDIDVLAGKASGIKTCAVTYGIGKRDDIERSAPDFIIDDILQLKEIVD